ncbi:MAG: hypothetical protein IK066_07595 [Kiritimatiellae bacterium]|nr:hypothetical protein [Kiritimatiellia bacterium]
MKRLFHLLPLLLAAGCASVPSGSAGVPPAAGGSGAPPPSFASSSWLPLFATLSDPDGTTRTLAAGPFSETAAHPSGTTFSAPLRPFYAHASDPASGRTAWDALWPLAQGKTFHDELSWRVLNAYYRDADTTNPDSKRQFSIYPFWFNGRTADGWTYHGLFPLGGTAGDFLLKDRLAFVLFPLWMRTQVASATTTDILWPLYSRTTTPDSHLDKIRVFPFYARSTLAGKYEKTSILWPFWSHARYDHPASHGTSWLLFPLFGRVNLSDQRGIAVLPPLFTRVVSSATNASSTRILWPIYRRDTGPVPRFQIWPLYGHRTDGALDRKYWLWPILSREKNAWGRERTLRWTLAPFYTYHSHVRVPESADPASGGAASSRAGGAGAEPPSFGTSLPPTPVSSRMKLWPLFSWQSANEPSPDFRFAALDLWPAPTPPPVARSWAPFWTLFDLRSTADAREINALWGLFHSERAPDLSVTRLFPLWGSVPAPATDSERHWSLLKGLLAYDRTPSGSRRLRVLWIPLPLSSSSPSSLSSPSSPSSP